MAEQRAGSRFSAFRGRAALLPNNNMTTSLDDLNVEPVPGFCDIVGSRASGGDVRACAEIQETHNNQSAVDATTPLCQMILGDGGGGRGAPAMAPGHPGAVDMRVGDVRARPRVGKHGAAWETSARGHRETSVQGAVRPREDGRGRGTPAEGRSRGSCPCCASPRRDGGRHGRRRPGRIRAGDAGARDRA